MAFVPERYKNHNKKLQKYFYYAVIVKKKKETHIDQVFSEMWRHLSSAKAP